MEKTVKSRARAIPLSTTQQLMVGLSLLFLLLLLTPGVARAAVPDVPASGAYIEAEDYTAMGAPNPWAWEIQSGLAGYNGSGYLYTTIGGTGTAANGSRVDFPVNFTTGGTYQVWLRARDASPSGNGDSTFWGIDGVVMGALTEAAAGSWEWTTRLQNGTNTATVSAGNHVINLWPREAGQHTDAIFIIESAQSLPGNIFEGSTAGVPTGKTALDFSATGPGAGYITIPDGQFVNGGPIGLLDTTASGSPGSSELEYQTDLSSLQYRALGGQSDGFHGFSLDSKWTKTDIGGDSTVAPTVNDGSLTLVGAGADIWNTRDFFSYLYQGGVSGDFTIDVKVASQQNTNQWAKAGIMVRQSLAANSRHAMVVVTPSNGVRIQYRPTDGATSQNPSPNDGNSAPEWLRLVRSGNTFTAWRSADGLSWTQVSGSASVTMSDPVYIGLAVTSHSSGVSSSVQFENFHFMPAATSGMSTSWASVAGSIDTTGWTDGTYGLALNSGGTFTTNLFDYSACVDADPSTISVPGSQTVSGSAVSLNSLFTHTGDVGNFTYQINGLQVNNPWNSFSEVADGASGNVTLSVAGTDPDCGGSLVSGSGTIFVDNTCSDLTPSTLTILTGQSTGGPTVDLTALVSQTGNLGALSYKINGSNIGSPSSWDSTGYGLATPESVTLEVTGTDPDCGAVVTALNTIEIDNTCTRNPPSISFDKDVNYVGAGRAIPYQVTVRNEDSPNCGSATFSVAITSDPVNGNFIASYFNPLGSNSNITLNGRESATIELAVEATSGASEWASKDTTLEITSSYTGDGNVHNTPKTTGTVTTKVFLVSPITHNSVTTHSTKWGGKWGTSETGAKYGNFDCLTCHQKDGSEVKWMRGSIATEDGSNWEGSGTPNVSVFFQDARPGGDWGHDDPNNDGSGRTSSTRPCEVCHSITMYHRYNTNADPTDPPEGPVGPQSIVQGKTHFPDRDCIDCHRHSLGFTASCIGCHGDPPLEATLGGPNGLADIPAATGSVTPGAHYKHVVVLEYKCEYCHAGWRNVGEMPKTESNSGLQQINHTFAVFGSSEPAATAGQYTGQEGVNYQPVTDLFNRGIQDANGTVQAGKGTMTCENIYCHGGTDNMGGTNPQWNGNISCNSCHGTSATNTPPGYSHTTHVKKVGLACTICHGTATGIGANGHVNGSVHIDLSELRTAWSSPSAVYNGVGGTASGAVWDSGKLAPSDPDVTDGTDLYGTCSNIACHYGTETPVWNNRNQPATCTNCHNDGVDSGLLTDAAPVTGAHAKHMSGSLMANTFVDKCQSCHGGGANSGEHSGHVNLSTDFAVNVSWDSGNRNCTNTCHDGSYSVNLWDSVSDLNCDACHKSPYIGPTVVDPAGGGSGMAASGYGSHLKTVKTETFNGSTDWYSQCKECHPYHSGGSVTIQQPTDNWSAATGTASPLNGQNMRSRLGLEFPITGGIHLGGTSTSGTTEADICWNCHGADDEINEWGFNADTNGNSWPQTDVPLQTTSAATLNLPSVWLPAEYTVSSAATNAGINYGWVYTDSSWSTPTSAWVNSSGQGNYRRDAYQHDASNGQILSQRISSVHSVNFDLTEAQGSSVSNNVNASGNVDRSASNQNETPGQIRCTYCHDVHDQNRALLADGVTNESATGRPYLRGSWMGNGYGWDVPPISGYSYEDGPHDADTTDDTDGAGTGNRFYVFNSGQGGAKTMNVALPRLFAGTKGSRIKGGYFIDQNSGWPTRDANYDTLDETAGICVLCHGSDVDNLDYYTGVDIWRSIQTNGHSNSTLGGTGSNAVNIFDAQRDRSADDITNGYMAMQAHVGATGTDWGKSTRMDNLTPKDYGPFGKNGLSGNDAGLSKAAKGTNKPAPPSVTGWYGDAPVTTRDTSYPTNGQYAVWYKGGVNVSTDTPGNNGRTGATLAHEFSCSKCHSPHASGLPALLITNCLDVTAGTWVYNHSDNNTFSNIRRVGPTNDYPNTSSHGKWGWVAANNCHRKERGSARDDSGWHSLAPGQ